MNLCGNLSKLMKTVKIMWIKYILDLNTSVGKTLYIQDVNTSVGKNAQIFIVKTF